MSSTQSSPAEQAAAATDQRGEYAAGDLPGDDQMSRAYLHQMSPSVLRMTREIEALAASFPVRLLDAIKQLTEDPSIDVHYHFSTDSYTTISQLQELPRQMLYRFTLPSTDNIKNDHAFVLFDPRLSALLTAICFGGSIADELALPTPGTEDRPTFSRIGKQLLDRLADALARAWQALCAGHLSRNSVSATDATVQLPDASRITQWLEELPSLPPPFTDDCLLTQFDLDFCDPVDVAAQTTVPVCFYTPINAFTRALVKTDVLTRADYGNTKARISRFLGGTDVTASVDLAPVTLSLDRLRVLKAGDVLPISDPSLAVMRIAGAALFLGTTGQQGGHLTLQIDNYGGQIGG